MTTLMAMWVEQEIYVISWVYVCVPFAIPSMKYISISESY